MFAIAITVENRELIEAITGEAVPARHKDCILARWTDGTTRVMTAVEFKAFSTVHDIAPVLATIWK